MSTLHEHPPSTSTSPEDTANILRDERNWFASEHPVSSSSSHYCTLYRAAVFSIYSQALDKLCTHAGQHSQIASETRRKVKVVLGIIPAEPDDPVFLTAGQLLAPLEPQYASPRIEYEADEYGYRAQYRIEAWRAEGWPRRYPAEAVRREQSRGEMLVGGSEEILSDPKLRERAVGRSDEELGGVVEVVAEDEEVDGEDGEVDEEGDGVDAFEDDFDDWSQWLVECD